MDLIPPTPGKPGRRQTVTAKAWVSRPGGSHTVFHSHVSLGDGKVHTLTAATTRRSKALDFNRSHLLARLRGRPAAAAPELEQLDLLEHRASSALHRAPK